MNSSTGVTSSEFSTTKWLRANISRYSSPPFLGTHPPTRTHDALRYFGTKTEENLQQKDTIYISEPKSPKGTTIRHSAIVRLLPAGTHDVQR